jgi:hypothetical protein
MSHPRPLSESNERIARLVSSAQAKPRDPLRSTMSSVARSTAPLPPAMRSLESIRSGGCFHPHLELRQRVRVPVVGEETETLSSGTDSFAGFPGSPLISPRVPSNPVADHDGSLRCLVAARRAAKLIGGATSRRRGATTAPTTLFPNQPRTSRFLANLTQQISATPLQLVLDVGSEEEDVQVTIQSLADYLRDYLARCACSVERQAERLQAVLTQMMRPVAEEQDAVVDVSERVRRRLASVSGASSPTGGTQRPLEDTLYPPTAAESPCLERPAVELLHQVGMELYTLTPRSLPDIVLCYWNFTLSDNIEDSLAKAFAPLGAAIERSRALLRLTNEHLAGANWGGDDVPMPPSCAVVCKLQYCRLRGVSFSELPLSFSPPSHETLFDAHVATPSRQRNRSFMIGNNFTLQGPLTTTLPLSPLATPQHSFMQTFQLRSLSVSHCEWRESSKFGLQYVLRNSGWSLAELELRGAHASDELVHAVSNVALRPGSTLHRVVWGNCRGWSTTDPAVQLRLVEGLRDSRSLKEMVFQGVPLPPKAGIALLDAIQHNPVIDVVRLESCHFVTPKFLDTLSKALSNPDRRSQTVGPPARWKRGSMSAVGLDMSLRKSSIASLVA